MVIKYKLNGKVVPREEAIASSEGLSYGEFGSAAGGHSPGAWPMHSDAMGIAPEDIPRAMKADAEMGVPIEYDRIGRAIYADPRQRKSHCEAHGFFDRNGSYGDPQRS